MAPSVSLALLLYTASIPPFAFRTDLFYITWITGSLVGLVWLVDLVRLQGRVHFARPYVALFAWFAWGWLGLLLKGVDLGAGISRLVSVALNLGMMVVSSALIRRGGERLLNAVVLTFGLASLIPFVVGLGGLSSGSDLLSFRFDAGMYNPNHTSFVFAVGSICLLYILLTTRRRLHSSLLVLPLVFLNLGILLTGSRQGIVVVVAGAFILLMFSLNRKRVVAVAALFVIASVFFALGLERSRDLPVERRIQRLFEFASGDTEADGSIRTRLHLVKSGLNMFRQNPLLGVGMGQYRFNIIDYGGPRSTYAHNNYVELLSSGGAIGFVLYYGVVLSAWLRAYRRRRVSSADVLILSLLSAVLVGDFFRVSYYQRVETTVLAMAIGMQSIRFYQKDVQESIAVGVRSKHVFAQMHDHRDNRETRDELTANLQNVE